MKKLLIGLIGLVFISGLVFPQALTERSESQIRGSVREILLCQIGRIQGLVRTMGEKSGIIAKSDLLKLETMIDDFFSLKEELPKKLGSPYPIFTEEDAMEIAFVFESRKAVEKYFKNSFWYEDDDSQTIKKFFTKYTGREMEIERAKNWPVRTVFGLCVGMI